MLKGIPNIISPELLKILCEMGHGDEIVLANANFPAVSCARRLIRLDGIKITDLLDPVLNLFPLDSFVDAPLALMGVPAGYSGLPPVWEVYRSIVKKHDDKAGFEEVERFAFYERAKAAFAIVATGEMASYSNLILKKGAIL